MFDFVVEVRDSSLARLGQIRPEDLSQQVMDPFNNVGTWTITLPASHPLAPALGTPGAGIVITRIDTHEELFSGPMTTRTVSASSQAPGGAVTFEGVSDTVILADRLAYPDPANPADSQTQAFDVRGGVAETRMHAYVNANIGPGAPVARRDTRLIMGTDGGRGSTPADTQARFDKLGTLLATIAAGENLGFRVIQRGSDLVFETYEVTDRTADIRLDVYNNTLASHKVAIAPPGATRVIAGGDGTGDNRAFVEVTSADSTAAEGAWGRVIEEFLDQRGTVDPAQLTQAGTDELAKVGQAEIAIQAVPTDATPMPFGTAWGLGDLVTVVVDGVELTSIVTGYVLKADKDGTRIGALIGDPSGFTADLNGRVTSLEGRVSSLERTAESSAITGEVRLWAGTGAPDGWHLADGTALSRTGEAALYAVTGTTYGVGDGSTTYNLPNLTAVSGVHYIIKL
jgi:hypothetical protein